MEIIKIVADEITKYIYDKQRRSKGIVEEIPKETSAEISKGITEELLKKILQNAQKSQMIFVNSFCKEFSKEWSLTSWGRRGQCQRDCGRSGETARLYKVKEIVDGISIGIDAEISKEIAELMPEKKSEGSAKELPKRHFQNNY